MTKIFALLFNKQVLLFTVIFLLAFILRVFHLSEIPSGFHNDEVSFVINALAIAETGKDEDGNTFPLYIKSFIDSKPALYSYIQIPFLALFENVIFASRLPAVFFGLFSLVIFYFLLRKLFNKRIAIISLIFLAISPWHIILSRGTQEVIMSFTFLLLAIYMVFIIIQSKAIRYYQIGVYGLCVFIALYSYHSAKVFLPLMLFSVLFLWYKKEKEYVKKSILIIGILLISLIVTLMFGGVERAKTVGIFSDSGTQLILDEQIRTATGDLHPLLIRAFHNKIVNYTLLIAKQYTEYFSPDFLFFSGGEPKRYNVPFHGLYYVVTLPLMAGGIIYFLKREKNYRLVAFLIIWTLVSPIAGSLTVKETPSIIRSFPLVVSLTVFIGYGFLYLLSMKNRLFKYLLSSIFIIVLVTNILYFLNEYVIQQTNYHPWYRNYAEQELAKTIKPLENKYESIVISGGGDAYVYFVLNDLISINDLQEIGDSKRDSVYTLGKFTFIRDNCVVEKRENVLYVVNVICEDVINKNGFTEVTSVGHKDKVMLYTLLKYQENSTESSL